MNAPYRVALSESTTSTLRSLTQKTGLSANLLSRFSMLISFEDATPPAQDVGKTGLTINRTTLFGELEPFIMSAYVMTRSSGAESAVGKDLANHIARGSAYLNVRVKRLADLLKVVDDLSEVTDGPNRTLRRVR